MYGNGRTLMKYDLNYYEVVLIVKCLSTTINLFYICMSHFNRMMAGSGRQF